MDILNELSYSDQEYVNDLLDDVSLSLEHKLAALEVLSCNREVKMRCIRLVNSQSSSASPASSNRTIEDKLPAVTEFPFLDKASHKRREKFITVFNDDSLTENDNLTEKEKKERKKERNKKLIVLLKTKDEKDGCKQFLSEMKKEAELLARLPKASRPDVASIIRETTMTFTEMRISLSFVLNDHEDRKKCKEYLKSKMFAAQVSKDQSGEKAHSAKQNFFEKAPESMNILLLGETGVGKSTFINGLANYLQYKTMYEAKCSRKMEILITSSFTLTDNNHKQRKIVCMAEGDGGNENLEAGKSATLSAKSYAFQWGQPGKQKKITLIDTPGVGDVTGYERDRQNFDNIFSHLADYSELHAICILLKPNEARINTSFAYCLGELFSRLHVSARKNITFCFTNTRGTLYRPGETVAILRAFCKVIEEKQNIEITINRSTMFCFDNESFRFLCALKEGMTFPAGEEANFNDSWKQSVEETFRFLTRISQLRPHNLAETLGASNIRNAFNILSRPMVNLEKKQQNQDKVIQEKKKEIAYLESEILKLHNNTNRNHKTTVRKQTGRIDTACFSCATPDEHNVAENHYKICHENCQCTRATKLETAQDVKLQKCSCIDKTSLTCTNCGCLWNTHIQIDFKLVGGTRQVADETVQHRIAKLQSDIATKQSEIASIESRKGGNTSRCGQINSSNDEFAAFLKKNTILPYNTHKSEYLEKLINEERQKVGRKSDKEMVDLENAKDEHERQVAMIDACTTANSKAVEQLEQKIQQLQKNDLEAQVALARMVLLKVRKNPMMRTTVVNLKEE